MIVRISKRDNPFVQIDKRPLENPKLSWRAKGILAYLLTKPDGWEILTDDIISHGTEGRDAVRIAMKELRENGYATLEIMQGDDGKAVGKRWVIFEECRKPDNQAVGAESLKNRLPEKPSAWKSATSNNKEENNNDVLFPLPEKDPKKKKSKVGHVNGSKPAQKTIEAFCVEVGLPASDGEIMLMKWNADGWPQNWMDKIRYWKHRGWMPSQKAKEGTRSALPDVPPHGWQEWLAARPEYARKCVGLTYRACPPWMHTEFVADRRKKPTAVAK